MADESNAQHLCFIIHSIRPYCFDFNDILALPSGFRYRNRFDRQWVERTVREEISALPESRILLILRDLNGNKLVPVRWAVLKTVQLVGNVLYFEYLLGDLITYSNESNVRDQEIVARTSLLTDQHSWLPGTAGKTLDEPSVFFSTAGNGLPTTKSSDLTAWGDVVSAIATAPIFSKIEFLKFVGLFGPDGSPAPVHDEALLIESDTVYTLRIFLEGSIRELDLEVCTRGKVKVDTSNGAVSSVIRRLQMLTDSVVFVRTELPLFGQYLGWLREGRKVTTIRFRKNAVEVPISSVLPLFKTDDYSPGDRSKPTDHVLGHRHPVPALRRSRRRGRPA